MVAQREIRAAQILTPDAGALGDPSFAAAEALRAEIARHRAAVERILAR